MSAAVRTPRARTAAPFVALGLIIAAVTAFAQRLGWHTFLYTNDELWAVRNGRALERDLFGALTDTRVFDRGPDRLNSLLHVIPNAVFDAVPDEFRAIHLILALAFALAAVPVYLMARGVGVGRWPAVLVGALAILTPWTLYAGTIHNATVAYATNMLFAYAAWRTAVRPSIRNDVFVLFAATLNMVARTGHAPSIVVALAAVVYAAWVRRPAGQPAGRALRALPRRVLGEHPVLIGAFALVLLVVAIVGPTRIVGSAYAVSGDFELPLRSIWDHTRTWFAMLTMGTGYLPVIIGGSWLLFQLVRPSSPETGVLAVVCLGLFAVFCYASGNSYSTYEERYVSVFAGLPVVAFGAALFRREARPLGALLLGVLAFRAIATIGIPAVNNPFEHLVTPAKLFFAFPVRGQIAAHTPVGSQHATLIAAVLIVGAAVVVALVCSQPGLRRVPRLRRIAVPLAAVVTGVLVVAGTAAGGYAMNKYRSAMFADRSSFEGANFIDAASGGEPTFLYAHSSDATREWRAVVATNATYFNRSLGTIWLSDVPTLLGQDGELPGPPTPYLARFPGFLPLGFDSEVVAESADLGAPMRVERFAGPPRAGVRLLQTDAEGVVPPGDDAVLEVFGWVREGRRCVRASVAAPEDNRRTARFSVRDARPAATGRLLPGDRRELTLRPTGTDPISIVIRTRGDDRLAIGDLAVVDCA